MSRDPYAGIVNHLFPGAKLKASARPAGGVSADVHRLELNLADGRATSVVLRAHGASHSGHSAQLEYELLQALHRSGVPVPQPLLVDASASLLANPFLVMAFVEGTSAVPSAQEGHCIDVMADVLATIHALPTAHLPEGPEWEDLRAHLRSRVDTAYVDSPELLHGDFWPENLLWQNGAVVAILDWEDAAFGDPLSDVACCRVELRYRFGKASMREAGAVLMG